MSAPRAHDLVRLTDPAVVLRGDEPGWVQRSLAAAPWAVVRRARAPAGQVAVGVRGSTRHERHALVIPSEAVASVTPPEQLRAAERPGDGEMPAIAALRRCAPMLDGVTDAWGPIGSVGFELASGQPTATEDSDLDLLVRVAALPPRRWAGELLGRLSNVRVRVDCQLEIAGGGVALAESAAAVETLVVRTSDGPRLVPRHRDPVR